jgi:predicted metal-dependent HD superfamily phosphohydrolase
MISPERLDALQRIWVWLVQPYGVDPATAYPVFDRVVAAYAEPHRHYHTLEHVGEVLRVVGRLASVTTSLRAVQLAAWLHDVVYDPRATDNETRSADLAERELRGLGVPPDDVTRVSELVRSTAHFAAEPFTGPDVDVLHDADLAILGASEVRYRRYADDVRKEYAWVPDADYRAGRTKVLQAFLARPHVYRTGVMRAEGEEAARRNMTAEIELLSSWPRAGGERV